MTPMQFAYERDAVMDRCRTKAARIIDGGRLLDHERTAWEITAFVVARAEELPDGYRDALLSLVREHCRVATYLSCGEPAILRSLAALLRLAAVHRDHPAYHAGWSVDEPPTAAEGT